ncbi:MAG: hypothetical protein P4L50_03790 [Anaerolineaceae bacterium]|nr:hypothetical protein [Anaerolineaceae bacterium]
MVDVGGGVLEGVGVMLGVLVKVMVGVMLGVLVKVSVGVRLGPGGVLVAVGVNVDVIVLEGVGVMVVVGAIPVTVNLLDWFQTVPTNICTS